MIEVNKNGYSLLGYHRGYSVWRRIEVTGSSVSVKNKETGRIVWAPFYKGDPVPSFQYLKNHIDEVLKDEL